MRDLGSNFFLTEADVGKPRASACAAKLAELNSMVTVRCVPSGRPGCGGNEMDTWMPYMDLPPLHYHFINRPI